MSRRIKILALVAAVALAVAVPAGFQVFDLNAGEVIIADNTNATLVTNDGATALASADNEAASMKTASTTAPYTITTGFSGDAIGGHVIAGKNYGGIILALEKTANIALSPQAARVLIC